MCLLLLANFAIHREGEAGSASTDDCVCVSEGQTSEEPDDSDVAQEITIDPETNSAGDDEASHWDATIAENFKVYLSKGCYPADLPACEKGKRRNFRKRAKDFVVQDDQLFYRDKKSESLRLAVYSLEDKKRVFEVKLMLHC